MLPLFWLVLTLMLAGGYLAWVLLVRRRSQDQGDSPEIIDAPAFQQSARC